MTNAIYPPKSLVDILESAASRQFDSTQPKLFWSVLDKIMNGKMIAHAYRGHGLPLYLNSKKTTRRKFLLADEHLDLSRPIGPIKMFDGDAVEVET